MCISSSLNVVDGAPSRIRHATIELTEFFLI
jgi:hypothetical protein